MIFGTAFYLMQVWMKQNSNFQENILLKKKRDCSYRIPFSLSSNLDKFKLTKYSILHQGEIYTRKLIHFLDKTQHIVYISEIYIQYSKMPVCKSSIKSSIFENYSPIETKIIFKKLTHNIQYVVVKTLLISFVIHI